MTTTETEGAFEALQRGINPTIGPIVPPALEDGQDLGRVFDAFTLREHLKDQSFDSEKGVWYLWEFVRTQCLAVFMGEFWACMIFSIIITILFSLSTGVAVAYPGGLLSVALGSWFACQLVIGKFGHISGAHINPAVTTLLYLMHLLHYIFTGGLWLFVRDTVLLLVYWVAQFGGWFAGVGIAHYIINDSAATANLSLPALGSLDGTEVGQFRAMFIEVLCVSIYLGVYAFGVVDRRLPERYAGHLMGVTMAAITFVAINFTGANFNFLRWLCTYAITGRPTSADWGIFIFAPIIAVPIVFVAVEMWRRFIEPTVEGKVDTMADPHLPPKNKYHSKARITHCMRGAPSYTPKVIKEKAEDNRRRMGLPQRTARRPSARRSGNW